MQQLNGIRIAVASASENAQHVLSAAFQQRGARVPLCSALDHDFVEQCRQHDFVDIVLLEMRDTYDIDDDALDLLLDEVDIPVLFHEDSGIEHQKSSLGEYYSELQIESLALKLANLVEVKPQEMGEVEDTEAVVATPDSRYAVNVWTLGASTGGPDAVQDFLSELPAELPIGFVLAQHLGPQFIPLLAEQLNRHTKFSVHEARKGESVTHGKVIVAPADKRILLDEKGVIDFEPENWKGHYRPSIDCVIDDVYQVYKQRSGIIIFSGMGADGVLASQRFHEQYQGAIWAQSAESCVISSMPDALRKSNLAGFSANPRGLAAKITERFLINTKLAG